MDVAELAVLEQGGGDEQAVVGRLLDERHDRRQPAGRRGERRQPRVVEPHRDLGGEVLEQVAGQPELREHDQAGAAGARLGEQLAVAREVRLEVPEARRDLGEGDPERLHAPSLGSPAAGEARRRRGLGRPLTASEARATASPAARATVAAAAPGGLELLGGPVDLLGEVAGDLVAGRQLAQQRDPPSEHRSGLPSRSRSQHRVWKRQPDGGATGDGTSPLRMIRRRRRSTIGSGIGTADSSATEYGCSGSRLSSRDGASSTIRPRYITAIRSLMWRTTDRSWAMNR